MEKISTAITSFDLMEREQLLNEINNELIEFSLSLSTPQDLDISNIGATRPSSKLLDFLRQNSATLQNLNFSANSFTSFDWLRKFTLPKLSSLNISGNPIQKEELDQLHMNFFMIELITKDQSTPSIPSLKEAKPLTIQYKAQAAKIPQQIDTEIKATPKEEAHKPKGIKGFFKKLF
ncbi:hypothetical protein [Candidatus Berkiella aquae]|nr:hypothetical protein [Candidatus Berkiella aquae]MCS5711808.1 hypothetical protein [Candidatus Berkiella aquae]